MSKEYWIFGVRRGCKVPVRGGYEEPGRWSEKDQRYYPGKKHPPINVIFNTFTGTAVIKDKVTAQAIMDLRGFRTEANPGGTIWLVNHVVEEGADNKTPIISPAAPKKASAPIVRGTRGTGSGKRKASRVSKFTAPPPEIKADGKDNNAE